jgi:hypothetical protein
VRCAPRTETSSSPSGVQLNRRTLHFVRSVRVLPSAWHWQLFARTLICLLAHVHTSQLLRVARLSCAATHGGLQAAAERGKVRACARALLLVCGTPDAAACFRDLRAAQ